MVWLSFKCLLYAKQCVIFLFLLTPALPGDKVGCCWVLRRRQIEEVVRDAGPREGRKWGTGAGWTDAAVMSETGHRRWPAQY